ncbi:unnamed protein product [Amoebophrya sp. A120]|nr:unnamed protein product [Amoebophrya sp. A120]|eukprot:GSA120T00005755001.1
MTVNMASSSSRLELGYWKIRGLASNLRYQLAYGKIPYQNVVYEQGDAASGFSKKVWTDVKFSLGMPFPNLPYLMHYHQGLLTEQPEETIKQENQLSEDHDVKISETQAIHQYLAARFSPTLLGQTPKEIGEINQLFGVLETVKNQCTGVCYRENAERAAIVENASPGFQRMSDYLEQKIRTQEGQNRSTFLTGDEVKWVDFYFLELVERFNWLLEDKLAEKYPVLQEYRRHMASLPGVAAQLEAELELEFNNKHSVVNGKAYRLAV